MHPAGTGAGPDVTNGAARPFARATPRSGTAPGSFRPTGHPDRHVARLAALFDEHPAWVEAARRIGDGASSDVRFLHRPGESWHLLRRGGRSLLLPGPATGPDFAFRFSPAAIDRLASVAGGRDDFTVALFESIVEPDPARGIGFRIVAPFGRLVRRGYLALVLESGPSVLAFGARHGVRSIRALRRLIREQRTAEPPDWYRGRTT